jgi:hypothetical protein
MGPQIGHQGLWCGLGCSWVLCSARRLWSARPIDRCG